MVPFEIAELLPHFKCQLRMVPTEAAVQSLEQLQNPRSFEPRVILQPLHLVGIVLSVNWSCPYFFS